MTFPADCKVCNEPLREIARYPVCSRCLTASQPLLAEHFCIACRTPFVTPYPLDEQGLCALCRTGGNGFDAAYSFASYEGKLQKLIHLFKYSGIYTLARPLANHLASALPRDQHFDAIVAVPMHWWREWNRGFNQAELLAQQLSRHTGLPLVRPVRRSRRTPPQAGLSDHERRQNLSNVFRVRKSVAGLSLLLVDDVMTTGATASACSKALKLAGAARVSVLTLARADRRVPEHRPTRALMTSASGG